MSNPVAQDKTMTSPVEVPRLDESDLKKEGCMVWAKVRGFSFWPGIVTVDPMDGLTLMASESSTKSYKFKAHIHFLGYDNMRAWVPDSNIMAYQGKSEYDRLAANCAKKNQKDYFPTKKYQRLFEKAVVVAEETIKLPQEVRLKKLGLVYVLIDEKAKKEDESENGHANLPKITSGFFKTYQPVLAESEKSDSMDVFDFDDTVEHFKVDFRLNEQNIDIKKEVKQEEMPKSVMKPLKKANNGNVQKSPSKALNGKTAQPLKSSPVKRKASPIKSNKQAKKRKVETPVKSVKVTSHNDPATMITDLSDAEGDDPDFDDHDYDRDSKPLLGTLIWGRMSGFPYWPCFITRGPDGDFRRTFGKRVEFHAQFFNWNNESGWVTGFLPWCPINEYQLKAKRVCPKGPNSPEGRNWYPPTRLVARWKAAVMEAQKTSQMKRKQRHNSVVVYYGSQPPVPTSKKVPIPSSQIKRPRPNDTIPQVMKRSKKISSLNRPCPASKKKVSFKGGLRPGRIELPKGWSYEIDSEDPKATKKLPLLKLHSPEGIVYDGVEDAVAHLMQQNCGRHRRRSYSTSSVTNLNSSATSGETSGLQNGLEFGWFLRCTDRMHFETRPYSVDQAGNLEGPVEYLKDGSLPSSWSVRTIRSQSMDDVEVLYQSSSKANDLRFKDKVSVARFLEGMGHPALEVEQLLFNYPKIASVAPRDQSPESEDEDDTGGNRGRSQVLCTIALSEWSVEDVSKTDLLAKTVLPCYVDSIQLPEIFLKHPSVRVSESDNEMIIRDAFTDAFIAKKIIYD